MLKKKNILVLLIFLLFISGCNYTSPDFDAQLESKPIVTKAINICTPRDISISNYSISVLNTGSMLPQIDEYDQLYFKYVKIEEIKVNDIINFNATIWNNYTGASRYVHRAVKIGYDNDWYAITKGDNVTEDDDGKRRFEDIKGVLICKK